MMESLFWWDFYMVLLLGSVLLVAGVMKSWEWVERKIDSVCAEWADHAD